MPDFTWIWPCVDAMRYPLVGLFINQNWFANLDHLSHHEDVRHCNQKTYASAWVLIGRGVSMKFPVLVLVVSMLSLAGCRETSIPTGFAGDEGLFDGSVEEESVGGGADDAEEDLTDDGGSESGSGDNEGGPVDDSEGSDSGDAEPGNDGPDGNGFDDNSDETCCDEEDGHEGSLCHEGERVCDGQAILVCRNGSWRVVESCADSETCDATTLSCAERVCERGDSQCVDHSTVQFCEPDEAGWMPPQPCGDFQFCLSGSCLGPQCAPSVMFLVDRSRSMAQSWSAVRNSVHNVAGLNHSIGYGLTVFPSREEVSAYHSEDQRRCSVGDDWPNVPILNDAEEQLRYYFDTNSVTGSTPLEGALRYIAANPTAFWPEAQGGYLIVITDGEDTCTTTESCGSSCVASQLGDHTRSLLQQGIKTYAVGYNYEGDRIGLNAIATNGGTSVDAHFEVSTELGLTSVLQALMLKIKACL